MKSKLAVALILLCILTPSQLFAQAEYSPLDSSGFIAFAGGATTEGAGAVGLGMGGSFGGRGDFTFSYAYGRSNSRGNNQVGLQASVFLGRRHSRSNIFLAFRAAVDQLLLRYGGVTVYTPSLSIIYMTNAFAKTSVVPSVSVGAHYSKSSPDGDLLVQAALGMRFLSTKKKCFYVEPGVGTISTGNYYYRRTTAMAFVSLGWIGKL